MERLGEQNIHNSVVKVAQEFCGGTRRSRISVLLDWMERRRRRLDGDILVWHQLAITWTWLPSCRMASAAVDERLDVH